MSDAKRRMEAYYYAFDETGIDAIDKILSAVACAGKAYHNTDQWTEETHPYADHTGESPVDWIQNAANEAAAAFRLASSGSRSDATPPLERSRPDETGLQEDTVG